ncbi:hypothetical protein [Lacinutrix mariniflava]|uniref:hypothetical protein n=1 Tax=Lacinutrix mariniflava TaxID=342955 RepID=UPI0006E14424|nr:hypothetical protein [Lacinutrix mariniflava]
MGTITIKQTDNASNSYSGEGIELDEFIPYVKLRDTKGYEIVDHDLPLEKDKNDKHVYVDLLSQTSHIKKQTSIFTLPIELKKFIIPFDVEQVTEDSMFQDDNGYLEVELSLEKDKFVKVEGATAKLKLKTEPEFSNKLLVKLGTEIDVEIEITEEEKSIDFYLRFIANDDEDTFIGEYENLFCGCFKVEFLTFDKDVFREEEISLLIEENKKAQAFNKTGNVIGNGYCINTADRGLGAILKDDKNFYTEPNYISQGGNGIRLMSSTSRALVIKNLGYIKSNIEIKTNNYNTNDKPTQFQSSLAKRINSEINNRKGYHLYYFSMHGEYHVMLLVINMMNPKNPTFSILDQGYVDRGSSSRNIPFSKLDETFLILAQAFWKNKNKHAKNILLWKIQRKS